MLSKLKDRVTACGYSIFFCSYLLNSQNIFYSCANVRSRCNNLLGNIALPILDVYGAGSGNGFLCGA